MNFLNIINGINWENFYQIFNSTTDQDIYKIVEKEFIDQNDFIKLLSPIAQNHLEIVAQKVNLFTKRYFGNAKQIFTPLYISNYCENNCSYCGYRAASGIKRGKLTNLEIEEECLAISKMGIRNILLLTGEAPKKAPFSYLLEAVKIGSKYFPMVGIEVQALTEDQYRDVKKNGGNYLTIYQETYNKEFYKRYHTKGPKSDYNFRILAPERAGDNHFVGINIGVLMGLAPIFEDIFTLGLHLQFLQKKYPDIEISFSLPRLRPTKGGFQSYIDIDDKLYVQMLLALKLFIPRAGATLSTRESENFRNNLLPLGVTKVSAGVKTSVGGYSSSEETHTTDQFEISDTRSVSKLSIDLENLGYQPVYKDWEPITS